MRKSFLRSMLYVVAMCISAVAWASPASIDMQSGYNVPTYGAAAATGESPPGVIAAGSTATYITLTSSSTAIAGSTASALASAGNTDNCSGCHGNSDTGSGANAVIAIGPGMTYKRPAPLDTVMFGLVAHVEKPTAFDNGLAILRERLHNPGGPAYASLPLMTPAKILTASAAPMPWSMYPQRE